MVTIQLSLPDDLHQLADEMGLLESMTLSQLLRDEMRRRSLKSMLSVSEKLAAINDIPLTDDEVVAEVKATRAEHRAARP